MSKNVVFRTVRKEICLKMLNSELLERKYVWQVIIYLYLYKGYINLHSKRDVINLYRFVVQRFDQKDIFVGKEM